MDGNVVITGSNAGIGLAIAESLAARGRDLVLVCRREAAARPVADRLGARLVVADLARPEGWAAAVAGVRAAGPVGCLVHNAGLWPTERRLTPEGFEASYAVNLLAPYALTAGLWPVPRVVFVAAGLYVKGRPDLDAAAHGTRFSPVRTYADTKLMQALFARELGRRAPEAVVHAVHPGVIRTGLGAGPGVLPWLVGQVKRFWGTPEAGADAPAWLAEAPAAEAPSGRFWDRRTPVDWHPITDDPALRAALWTAAGEQTGESWLGG